MWIAWRNSLRLGNALPGNMMRSCWLLGLRVKLFLLADMTCIMCLRHCPCYEHTVTTYPQHTCGSCGFQSLDYHKNNKFWSWGHTDCRQSKSSRINASIWSSCASRWKHSHIVLRGHQTYIYLHRVYQKCAQHMTGFQWNYTLLSASTNNLLHY